MILTFIGISIRYKTDFYPINGTVIIKQLKKESVDSNIYRKWICLVSAVYQQTSFRSETHPSRLQTDKIYIANIPVGKNHENNRYVWLSQFNIAICTAYRFTYNYKNINV